MMVHSRDLGIEQNKIAAPLSVVTLALPKKAQQVSLMVLGPMCRQRLKWHLLAVDGVRLPDSIRSWARVSHATYNANDNTHRQEGFIEDDVFDANGPSYDAEARYKIHPSKDATHVTEIDALTPYHQRSTSFLTSHNALHHRLSMTSTDSVRERLETANVGKLASSRGASVSPSPTPSQSKSAPTSKANSTRASSIDSFTAQRMDDDDLPNDESMHKSRRPSLSRFRVRFRSRVRIASGMRHSKHECTIDCSPSSSISAPLRESTDNLDSYAASSWLSSNSNSNAARTGSAVPKSQPIAFVDDMFGFDGAGASSSSQRSDPPTRQKRPRRPTSAFPSNRANSASINERTPLTSSLHPHSQSQPRRAAGSRHASRARHRAYLSDIADSDEEDIEALGSQEERARIHSLERAARRRDEELVFGRWPWRLVNGYVSLKSSLPFLLSVFPLQFLFSYLFLSHISSEGLESYRSDCLCTRKDSSDCFSPCLICFYLLYLFRLRLFT